MSLGSVGSKDTSICWTHPARRLFGQEVALKSVDAYNSPHLIPHLQCEADVLSGARLHRNKRSLHVNLYFSSLSLFLCTRALLWLEQASGASGHWHLTLV